MNTKLSIYMLCMILPFSALADEQVIHCAISTKAEIDKDHGTRHLEPINAVIQFKLFYVDRELVHVEKMPKMSRCKGGTTVSIGSDLVELTCESTLFNNYVVYHSMDRYTGEYRAENTSSDGKIVQIGNCNLAKTRF